MKTVLRMIDFTNLIMIDIDVWDRIEQKLANMLIALDTGASITTISDDILQKLGYDTSVGLVNSITTASGKNYVRTVTLDRIILGDIELTDIETYAHTFPQGSFLTGVLGLNVLRQFDLNLVFSKKRIEFTLI